MPFSMQIHAGEIVNSADLIIKWIQAVATSASIIAVTIGIWLSLREYRLKVASERRQQTTSEIESEVRLQAHFGSLMGIANGRNGYLLSEEAAKFALQNLSGTMSPEQINRVVATVSVVTLPVGSAQQDAAVAAIAALTVKYDVLREPGIKALESLCNPATSTAAVHYLDWARGRIDGRNHP